MHIKLKLYDIENSTSIDGKTVYELIVEYRNQIGDIARLQGYSRASLEVRQILDKVQEIVNEIKKSVQNDEDILTELEKENPADTKWAPLGKILKSYFLDENQYAELRQAKNEAEQNAKQKAQREAEVAEKKASAAKEGKKGTPAKSVAQVELEEAITTYNLEGISTSDKKQPDVSEWLKALESEHVSFEQAFDVYQKFENYRNRKQGPPAGTAEGSAAAESAQPEVIDLTL